MQHFVSSENRMIKVIYFAGLREAIGISSEKIAAPTDLIWSIDIVRTQLVSMGQSRDCLASQKTSVHQGSDSHIVGLPHVRTNLAVLSFATGGNK